MKQKNRNRISAVLIAFIVAFAMTGATSVMAAEDYTSETLNHGMITISGNDNNGEITLQEGEKVTITVSPYQHIQYTGCMTTPQCPDVCGSEDDCFVVGKGCKCDTAPILRTTDITAQSSVPEVASVSQIKADTDLGEATADNVSATTDGTFEITGLSKGTAEIDVSASLRDWVSATKTYTVNVTEKKADPAVVSNIKAWTDYVANEDRTNAEQTIHVELTFDKDLTVNNEAALLDQINSTISFGSGLKADKTTAALKADGRTVLIESSGWGAQVAGYFVAKGDWTELQAENGYAAPDVKFLVPNGLTTKILEQTAATETAPASVTTQIIEPAGCTRGMVHLVLLKNGKPVTGADGNLDQYGGTLTSHFHDFLNMGATGFANNLVPSLKDETAGRYVVDYVEKSDTFKVTAVESEPGDIIEFHILSYENDGTPIIKSTADLEAAIADADKYKDNEGVQDKLAKASLINADVSYYSQADIDAASEALNIANEAAKAEKEKTDNDKKDEPAVKKKANTIKISPTKKTYKVKTLKKAQKTFKIKASVKGKAKTSFKLVSVNKKSAKKYFKVSSSGKVTVKKKLKKGTYKLKVKVTSAATKTYKKTSVNKTIKITVKK